jgi:hypothetical protein
MESILFSDFWLINYSSIHHNTTIFIWKL